MATSSGELDCTVGRGPVIDHSLILPSLASRGWSGFSSGTQDYPEQGDQVAIWKRVYLVSSAKAPKPQRLSRKTLYTP
jgi:hypothetical protein